MSGVQKSGQKDLNNKNADRLKNNKVGQSNSNKMSTRKRLLIGIGIAVLLLVVVGAIAIALIIQNLDNRIKFDTDTQKEVEEALAVVNDDDPYYVLLLGSDSRTPGDISGNTDTIVLARIDPKTPQVTLLSIPRDTEVQLEGYGSEKINAAMPYLGEAGAIKAVANLTGTEISHFIAIDFEGVIGLVDILGGIEVNVPMDIELDGVFINAGPQVLDGKHALIMSRCRSFPAGDLVRVENQRLLLQAVAKKILAASPTELPGLIGKLASCVKSDVSTTEAVSLLARIKDLDPEKMYMATAPTFFNYHDETSFLGIQEPEFSQMMDRIRQGLPPVDPETAAATTAAE